MKQVIPNQKPMETMDERLRRLTKETLSSQPSGQTGGPTNSAGPTHMHPANVNPALTGLPGGVPHDMGADPQSIIHRLTREAMKPSRGRM